MTTPSESRSAERVYRRLLRLLPKPFREEAEAEMVEVFRAGHCQARRRAGGARLVRFWLRVLVDLALTMASTRLPRGSWATRSVWISTSPLSGRVTSRRRAGMMAGIARDTRYAIRALTRRAGFTTILILTFALGVGSTTAVFTAVRHVLLEPLPFDAPEQLVQIWETRDSRPNLPFSIPNMESVRQRAGSFTDVGAWMFGDFPSVTLTGGDRPERIPGAMITPNLISVLGVEPMLGRSFTPEEREPGNEDKVILSYQEWSIRFDTDANILGRVLELNGTPHSVVGVMPPGFEFPVGSGARVWRPLPFLPAWRDNRRNRLLEVLGRLDPGVSVQAAEQEVASLGLTLAQEYPESNGDQGMRVVGLHEQTVGDIRPALIALTVSALLLWLVAVANIANLGLARVLDRRQEVAVRAAHGASRLQIARLVTIESLSGGVFGAGLGLALAYLGIEAISVLGPANIPRIETIEVDATAIGFGLGLAALTALVASLMPMFAMARNDLVGTVALRSSSMSMSKRGRSVRGSLIGTEFALALVLLIGAGLLLQSFVYLSQVDPGFRADHLLTAEVNLPFASFPDSESRMQFYGELLPSLQALPGVTAAGAVSVFPLSGNRGGGTSLHREGANGQDGFVEDIRFRVATPTYFQMMEMTLLSGRGVSWDDTRERSAVAVINEALASRLWPGQDPVGRIMLSGRPDDPGTRYEVIGLLADIRGASLASSPQPRVYAPYGQAAMQEMVIVVRTPGAPGDLAASLQRAVLAVNPDQPLEAIRTGEDILSDSIARPRFTLFLLSLFTLTAIGLSTVGIYGVSAQAVAARTREIGLRIALGASRRSVVGMTLAQGLRQTLVGLAVGLVVALLGTRLLASMVFGVSTTDTRTFVSATLILIGVAILGSLVPSVRASRVDAVRALITD